MERPRKANEQGAVVLRHGELAVGLLPELDATDREAEAAQIADLGDCVLRRAVQQGDGCEHRSAMRQTARQDATEAGLLHSGIAIARAVPGIGRRHVHHGLAV